MFENVIVGVDGRPNGRDAIALGSRLLGAEGRLTLANVHGGAFNPTLASTPGRLTEEKEASHELLARERAAAEVLSLPIYPELAADDANRVIAAIVNATEAA